MKRLRPGRRLWLALVAVVVLALAVTAVVTTTAVRQAWPQVSGEITLDGLAGSVTVLRDGQGVPHIYADTPTDLFRAQGFVAAQDRFFEMDLRRRVTSGRLAELVGAPGLASDQVVRTLGWRKVAEDELPRLAPATRQYLQAYADGVNDYLSRTGETSQLSLEYALLDRQLPAYRPERWSAVDSLAWLKAMAWDLKANFSGELDRARLQASIDPSLVAALYPPYPTSAHAPIVSLQDWSPDQPAANTIAGSALPANSVVPPSLSLPPGTSGGYAAGAAIAPTLTDPAARAALERTAAALDAIPALLGRGEGVGSNSWVVGPSRSATGAAMLANDPHLAVQLPGVFHQTGLHCRKVSPACPFDVSGFTFAGLPGVIIGHNSAIAWGLTNLPADTTDLYFERVSGAAYLRDGRLVPLEVSTETIQVRGGDPVPLTVRRTGHGPIVSDVIEAAGAAGRDAVISAQVTHEDYAVSLAWVGLVPTATADAIFALNTAQNFTEFRAAAKSLAVPAQGLVYADVQGNIGYQAPGLIPVRRASTPGVPPGYLPSPGWDSQWDWQGWVAFEDLPWVLNPAEGLIVAANQQVTPSPTPYLTTEWAEGWRSQRIRERLAGVGKVSPADMQDIQLDTRHPFAKELVAALLAIDLSDDPYTREAQELLRGWDLTQPTDRSRNAAAAAYYNAVWRRLLRGTFDDQLPAGIRADGGGRWWLVVRSLLANPGNPWWDDKRTPSVIESRDQILTQALVDARLDLTRAISSSVEKWSWGQVHTVTLRHQVLGGDSAPGVLRWLTNRGPIAVPGGGAVVNAMAWDASQGYQVTRAPAMRMVVDLGNLDASTWVNQTGVSGHPAHPHYADQVDAWAGGRMLAWAHTESAVQAVAVDELTFVP